MTSLVLMLSENDWNHIENILGGTAVFLVIIVFLVCAMWGD